MRDYFTIGISGDYKDVVAKILAQAQSDPCILHLDREKLGHSLIFCPSPEVADFMRQRFEESGAVSPSMCVLRLNEFGIFVNQECADDSREGMAEFVKWILRTFAPCRVFDSDADKDISELASQKPQALFE